MPKVSRSCLSARPNAIGFVLEAKPKSLQHEYKCSFGNGVGPQNFEFSKKNDYKPHINEGQWLTKNIGRRLLGLIRQSDLMLLGLVSATIPNAFGSGWAARPKESWAWLDNLFPFKIFSILYFFRLENSFYFCFIWWRGNKLMRFFFILYKS